MSSLIYPARPETILKELGKVWTALGEEEKQQGKPTVLRACAMTLIVATDDDDTSGFEAAQALIQLMHEHPSRSITLRLSDESEKGLEARVLAQCWKPFGKAQQICCEQIEITANHENWPFIRPTLIGLTVADLPVVLWCRQKNALAADCSDSRRAGLEAAASLASKVIIDSADSPASSTFKLIDDWQSHGRVVADLEWTRLTPWREVLANAFDGTGARSLAGKFHRARITHTDANPRPSVLYMGGWLQSRLKLEVSFEQREGHGSGLQQIVLEAGSESIQLQRTSNDCMTLNVGGRGRKYNYADLGLYTLMTEELAVLGDDPMFNAAFTAAKDFANK